MRRSRLLPLPVLAALLAACHEDLALPPEPGVLMLEDLTPLEGFAGETVSFRLTPSDPGQDVRVTFGTSLAVAAWNVEDEVWRVEVPEDATTGPVRAITGSGVAVSSPSFRFIGAGRLLHGRVAKRYTFDVTIADAIQTTSPDRTYLLRKSPAWGLEAMQDASGDARTWSLVQGVAPRAMAASPDGTQVATLGYAVASEVRALCPEFVEDDGDFFVVHRMTAEALAADDPPLAYACLGGFFSGDVDPMLAFDAAAGTAVAVVNGSRLWSVDFSQTPPAVQLLTYPSFFGDVRAVAPLSSGRFAVLEKTGTLREVDPRTPMDTWGQRALPAEIGDTGVALATFGRLLAIGTSGGDVLLLDAAMEPLAVEAALPRTVLGPQEMFDSRDPMVGHLAFSADGTRLAVSQPDFSRVTVVQHDGSGSSALGQTRVARPARIHAAPDGTFLVGAEHGAWVFSQQSGNAVGRRTALGYLGHPNFRRSGRGSSGALRLDVSAGAFGLLPALDPLTLLPLDEGQLLSRWTDVPPAGLREVVSTPDRSQVVIAFAGELALLDYSKTLAPDPTRFAPFRYQAGLAAEGVSFVRRLAMSPDGRTVLADDLENGRILVLDTEVDAWETLEPVELPRPEGLVAMVPDAFGGLSLVTRGSLLRYDLEAVRRGELERLEELEYEGSDVAVGAGAAGDRLFIHTRSAVWNERIQVYGLAVPRGYFDVAGKSGRTFDAFAAAPGGKRAVALVRDPDGGRSVVSFDVTRIPINDFEDLVEDLVVRVQEPGGDVRNLVVGPGGDRVYLTDEAEHAVLLVE